MDVTEAAAVLGVSTESVRKRLLRGTLAGRKVDGKWEVDLPARPAPPDAAVQDSRTPVQDASGRGQDASAREEELLRRIAWLEQRVESAEAERAELRRLLAEVLHQLPALLPAPQDAVQDATGRAEQAETAPAPAESTQPTPAPKRGFWARLRGR